MRELIAEEEASKVESIRAKRRAEATDSWHNALPGDGNAAFFRLGCDLSRTGMSDSEISSILWQEAGHGDIPISGGLRSSTSCGRCGDRHVDWRRDRRWISLVY